MAWIAITESYVQGRLSGPELTAVKTAALAQGQSNPVTDAIVRVVDEMRGYIAAGGVTLGAGNTIPEKLLDAALAMIRYRICTRIPAAGLLTEARKNEYDGALRLLERVADGKFLVEEPTTADTESSGSPSPQVEDRTLTMDRSSQDGI